MIDTTLRWKHRIHWYGHAVDSGRKMIMPCRRGTLLVGKRHAFGGIRLTREGKLSLRRGRSLRRLLFQQADVFLAFRWCAWRCSGIGNRSRYNTLVLGVPSIYGYKSQPLADR